MNSLLTALGISDITPVLLIAGVALLLINIVYGIIRVARGNLRAGWFTLGLALLACVFIGVGSARSAMATAAFISARSNGLSNRSAPSTTPLSISDNGNAANTNTIPVISVSNTAYTAPTANGATSTRMAPPTNTPLAVAQVPSSTPNLSNTGDTGTAAVTQAATSISGAASATSASRTGPGPRATTSASDNSGIGTAITTQSATSDATPAASATQARRPRGTGTPGAVAPGTAGQSTNPSGQNPGQGTDGNGQSGASGGNSNSSSGNSARTGSGAAGGAPQTNQNALQIAVFGGGLSVVLALGLFFFERRRDGFAPTNSRGLLNAGASLFVLVAALVIPMLPGQLAQAQPTGAGAARNASAFTRSVITATPSPLPTQTKAPTAIPSLTPTMTDTPLATPTEISYAAAQPTAPPTAALTQCMVTVSSGVNLRADPSTANTPLLAFQSQTTLSVSGETSDKKWWQVIYNNNGKTVMGWLSVQVTKSNGKCDAVAVISPTPSS